MRTVASESIMNPLKGALFHVMDDIAPAKPCKLKRPMLENALDNFLTLAGSSGEYEWFVNLFKYVIPSLEKFEECLGDGFRYLADYRGVVQQKQSTT